MATSVTKSYDVGLKALLHSRYKTILGIEGLDIKYGIIQCPEEIALRELSERRGDNWLDYITFYRTSMSPSWSRQRTPLAQRGVWLSEDVLVKAQPIDLGYHATFWSRDVDKLYQVIEKYITWQHDFPRMQLTYLDTYPIEPNLHFGEITDESTYNEKYDTGIIFAFRMPIKIDGWVLTSTTAGLVEKIRLTIYDKDEVTDYSSIMVEDSGQDIELEAILRLLRRHTYDIKAASTSGKSVTISGDFVSDFTAEDKIIIQNSTGNNGLYTLVSATLTGQDTVLVFEEAIASSVGDGVVYKEA